MPLEKINESIYTFEFTQKIIIGVHFPARSTILCLENQAVVIISPGPFDPETITEISALGNDFYIIAPNLFHHFYFLKAKDSFPNAKFFAPEALGTKIKDIAGHYQQIEELPELITHSLKPIFIKGNKTLEEWVFFHKMTKTLILTDLVFYMKDQPSLTRFILKLVGAYNHIAQSKLIKKTIQDPEQFLSSVKGLFSLKPDKIVIAHGSIITDPSQWNNFLENYRVK